jgi:hypothetical protein
MMTRKNIPISQLKRGPIRHEQLSLSLTARINYLQEALNEVYPQPIEKWLDEFKRDTNPESEVVWWERLARCYVAYREANDLSAGQKLAAFKVLFNLAMGSGIQSVSAEIAKLPSRAQEDLLAMMGPKIQ